MQSVPILLLRFWALGNVLVILGKGWVVADAFVIGERGVWGLLGGWGVFELYIKRCS